MEYIQLTINLVDWEFLRRSEEFSHRIVHLVDEVNFYTRDGLYIIKTFVLFRFAAINPITID